jgi:hypothetical protein
MDIHECMLLHTSTIPMQNQQAIKRKPLQITKQEVINMYEFSANRPHRH